jgi:hypothetical protein
MLTLKHRTLLFILLSVILQYVQPREAVYDLFTLETQDALCLDGSPAAHYISQEGDPNKILIFFDGAKWCNGKTEE